MLQSFWTNSKSPPTEYALVCLRWEKFLPGSDGEPTEQPMASSVPQAVLIVIKTKHPILTIVSQMFTSNSAIMLPFIFPHGLRLNRGLHKVPRTVSVTLYHEGGYWNTGCLVTQAEESSVGCQEISATTLPIASGRVTPQITFLLIIMCGSQLSKRTTKLHAEQKARITISFP